MLEFKFTGLDSSGKNVGGIRSASSADELANALAREDITPIDIFEIENKPKASFRFALNKRVKPIELQLLCRQLYTLIKAGIPITMAIHRLAETSNNAYLRDVLMDVTAVLGQGQSLSYALAKYPKIFSELFINIVSIGENTGQLEEVFLKLSDYLGLEIETKKKITAALRYPIIVVSVTIFALLIINAFVIPNFAKIFARLGNDLPVPTKILIGTSNFLINYWPFILIFVVISVIAFNIYIQTPEGKRQWHYFILKLPLVGNIINRMYLARFCRLYSLMLRSGIPAVDAIVLVGQATGNAHLAYKIRGISEKVARGSSISNACFQTQMFSSLVIQMLSLGEDTGKMDDMLDDVSEYYEREVNFDLARLSDLIEPVLLIMMAAMVLILALGVFLPMWDMIGHKR